MTKIVRVVWEDSIISATGWEERKKVKRRRPRTTILTAGYLVRAKTKHLLVCVAIHPGADNVTQCISIPRSAVRSMKTLKL